MCICLLRLKSALFPMRAGWLSTENRGALGRIGLDLARARLRSIQAAKKLKSLLITSPLPEDGKSTVALNLATVLSENGKAPVLLLEADVYRPGLIKKLGSQALAWVDRML